VHIGEQLVDQLIEYGVEHVFGCPGGQTLPLYSGITRRPGQIDHVLMRDERSAIYAADGYARAKNRVGVCDATVGPGASNLVSGLIEAYACSTPLLAIVSDIPRQWEHRRYLAAANQAFDQRGFLEASAKSFGHVDTPENLGEILQSCVRIATSGRPGPVVLSIPADVFVAEEDGGRFPVAADWAEIPRLRPGPDPDVVAQASDLLASSQRPTIVAGGGVLHAQAGEEVQALAELLGCPIATTMSGKGTVAETHPLSVGVVGRMGHAIANSIIAESDCVVFVGCKTGQATTLAWTVPKQDVSVIQIDIDPAEVGRNYRNAVGLFSDARLGVSALTAALRGRKLRSDWDGKTLRGRLKTWWEGPVEYAADAELGVLKPQDVVRSMRAIAADDAVMVADASLATGWVMGHWQVIEPGRRIFSPRGMGGLGWGLPGAIGVSVAGRGTSDPGRVVCLAGDGGWAYSLGEVETATRLGLPIISVILNNSTLAWIKHHAGSRFPGEKMVPDFAEVDYAESARGLGAVVRRVESLDAFEAAFAEAIADEPTRPWVIETRSSDLETPVLPSSGGY